MKVMAEEFNIPDRGDTPLSFDDEKSREKSKGICLDWLPIVNQAISEEHNVLVARLCTLLEAAIPNNMDCQLEAIKRMVKDIIREEQDRVYSYLSLRAHPNDIPVEPAEYRRFWAINNNRAKQDNNVPEDD